MIILFNYLFAITQSIINLTSDPSAAFQTMSTERGKHGPTIRTSADNDGSYDGSTSNARSQLSSAQMYLAEVQELLGVVENHIDDSKASAHRRRFYRRRTTDIAKQEPLLSHEIARARVDEYPSLFDVTTLKSATRQLKEKKHQLDSFTDRADENINLSGPSQHGEASKEVELEKATTPLLGKEELTGVLKSSKSSNELISNKRVSFVETYEYDSFIKNEYSEGNDQQTRIPIDPEAVQYAPETQAAHTATGPKTDVVKREWSSDDHSVLSLFSVEAVSDNMPKTINPAINNDHVGPNRINNNGKMSKKSLDRPTSRRHSMTSQSGENKLPSYSRSKSDACVNLGQAAFIQAAQNDTDFRTKDDLDSSVPSLITMEALERGLDDQSSLSNNETPTIYPDKHFSPTRIKNCEKMFKKSLDRPMSRRRSCVRSSRRKSSTS